MRFYLALWLAKIINTLINLVSKGRGSNLSGEKAMAIDPRMVEHFKGIDYRKVLFITGTNGKSSTTNMVNHILTANGKTVVSNLEGANLITGIATILAKHANLLGRVKADYYVFETDERYLPLIYDQLPAKNLLVTNLQKDQVQRNGDPDFIYRKIAAILNPDMTLFLNNEEPRSKSFEGFSDHIITYGVEKHSESFTKDESFPTEACPRCYHKVEFEYYNNDGVGPFHCEHCGFSSEPTPHYRAENIDIPGRKFAVEDVPFEMPYDLPFMFYNYAGSVAVAKEMAGISIEDSARAIASFKNIGGRFEVLNYKGKTVKYMRIKQENPDTLQNTINIMAADKEKKMVAIGLYPLVDFVPHYTNSFYAFDCDFKGLEKVERYLCFSPAVAGDTANRLIYDGVDPKDITIYDGDDIERIMAEIEQAETDNVYLITWLDTYNKMESILKEGAA